MQPRRSGAGALWRSRLSSSEAPHVFEAASDTSFADEVQQTRIVGPCEGDRRLEPNDLAVWRQGAAERFGESTVICLQIVSEDSSAHLRGQPSISIDTGVRTRILYDLLDLGTQFQGVSTGIRLWTVLPTFQHGIAIAPGLEDPTTDVP
jgi:hypothetical protein